jgi:hypothetical protein
MRHDHNHYLSPGQEEYIKAAFFSALGTVAGEPLNTIALRWLLRVDFGIQSGLGNDPRQDEEWGPRGGLKMSASFCKMTPNGTKWTGSDGRVHYNVQYPPEYLWNSDFRQPEEALDCLAGNVAECLSVEARSMASQLRDKLMEQAFRSLSTMQFPLNNVKP